MMIKGSFDNQIDFDVCFDGVIYNRSEKDPAALVARMYKNSIPFSELDGAFVIVIRDGAKTIITRDHHGTGAQIYYNNQGFASSLAELDKKEIDYNALSTFLSVGYIPTGESSFKGISKLGAGCMLVAQGGKIEIFNLFDTSTIKPVMGSGDIDALSQKYGKLHSQAIKRRIGESQNVGMLLSGGYDSGCNLAALRKIYYGDIHTYSIGFKGDSWSELPLAQHMAEVFGTKHNQYEIDGSEISALPEIVRHLGDPFVEGGLMVNYSAMRLIGDRKPDIILGGDGSDQYFGTSGREVAIHYLAAKIGMRPLLNALHTLTRSEKNNTPYRVHFHLSKILNILQGDLFGFERFELEKLLKNSDWLPQKYNDQTNTRSFEHLYIQHAYESDLEKIINQVILFKASRMAEMFDNKIAFPYMDLELYKFLQGVPVKCKCKGESAFSIAKGDVTAKFLLKYHYKPMLPEAITSKKKQGGFAPMPIFFKDENQRERIADFIMNSSVATELLNKKEVEKFIRCYDSSQGNWFWYRQNKAIQYFNLLTLAIWWETYVKSNNNVSL